MVKPGNIAKVDIDLGEGEELNDVQLGHKVALEQNCAGHFSYAGKGAGSRSFELYITVHEGMIVGSVLPADVDEAVDGFAVNVEDLADSELDFVHISAEQGVPGSGYGELVKGIHKALEEAHVKITGPHKDIVAGKLIALLRESVSPIHEILGARPGADSGPVLH